MLNLSSNFHRLRHFPPVLLQFRSGFSIELQKESLDGVGVGAANSDVFPSWPPPRWPRAVHSPSPDLGRRRCPTPATDSDDHDGGNGDRVREGEVTGDGRQCVRPCVCASKCRCRRRHSSLVSARGCSCVADVRPQRPSARVEPRRVRDSVRERERERERRSFLGFFIAHCVVSVCHRSRHGQKVNEDTKKEY